MTKVAPLKVAPLIMDREALVARFGECEANEGTHEYTAMKDGWKIHRETWTPGGAAKAVILFCHGDGESTRTIGMRRLAAACLKRGFILETFDTNGHGESLEKNGQPLLAKKWRGVTIEKTSVKVDHLIEIAELVIKKHGLPLVIAGHSGGGLTCCLATDRVIELCEANGVPFVTGLYLSPGLEALRSQAPCGLACCRCCVGCCWLGCCCNCCGKPCLPVGGDYNPEDALGEDNTFKYLHLGQLLMNTKVYPDGPADVPQAAERMTKLKDGLAFIGSKDENIKVPVVERLGTAVPGLQVEVKEGLKHDYLNMNKPGETASNTTIDYLLGIVDAKLP